MVLPRMGGSEIAMRIRELVPRTKVLYSSGYTDDVIVRLGSTEVGAAFPRETLHARNARQRGP
jgi:two-component system, cell cycle sensor histidine kinase and response regulator CckA